MPELSPADWKLAGNLAAKTLVVGAGLWAAVTGEDWRNLAHDAAAFLLLVAWCYLDDCVTPGRLRASLIAAVPLYLASVQVAHLLLWAGQPGWT